GNLPFVLREPADLLARDVEQSCVVVAVAAVGGNQNALAVGRHAVGRVAAFALVRRQQRALGARYLDHKHVRVRPFRLFLGVDDELAIGRPEGRNVHTVLRGAGGEVLHFAHDRVVNVNFEYRRRLRLDHVGEVTAIVRPGWTFLGDLAGVG